MRSAVRWCRSYLAATGVLLGIEAELLLHAQSIVQPRRVFRRGDELAQVRPLAISGTATCCTGPPGADAVSQRCHYQRRCKSDKKYNWVLERCVSFAGDCEVAEDGRC